MILRMFKGHNGIKINRFLKENPITVFFQKHYGTIIILVVMVAVISIKSPIFFTAKNGINILRQLSLNAILTCSLTLCIISGSIDLSVGPVLSISGILFFSLLEMGYSPFIAISAAMIFGMLIGLINGLIIANTNIPPFIVTLASMYILSGAGFLYTDCKTILFSHPIIKTLGRGMVFDVLPLSFVITVVAVTICYLLLYKTKSGNYIYAVGGNEKSSVLVGIRPKTTKILVHYLSGTYAALAGILLSSRMGAATARVGLGYEADAIAAAVLGGVSLVGGRGTLGGAMVGALVLAVLKNGMTQVGIMENWQLVAKGVLIVFAVIADNIITVRKTRKLRELNKA